MQMNFLTPVKDSQNSQKPCKSHNQAREGDWVCLNCNNLNFSFRKKCNRCKTQTRKQNQDIQNAYTLYFYNQHENNMFNYENSNTYQKNNDQLYYPSEFNTEEEQLNSSIQGQGHPLAFSRNIQNHFMEITITSPDKKIINTDEALNKKFIEKLRTPSSKKKRTQNNKNDMLPSVSPLLKKLLAKEDTNGKPNSSNTKDPLNVALFYDQIWDSNKENFINVKNAKIQGKLQICLTNSGKKVMRQSRMQKTTDTLECEEEGFEYLMRSPTKDYEKEEIIEIDDGDQELAQIINRIII